MQAEIAKGPVRPWWRRVLRVFFWIFLVLLVPVVCFVVYNRIDEAPSELALKFENMPDRKVADADNAWLAMVGLGAPDGVSTAEWGRRKVDAFNATPIRSLADSSEPAIESSQPEDAHVTIWPDPKPPIDDRHCPKRDVDCLQWALDRATRLRGFQQANAVLLTRLDALMQLPEWQARYQQRVDTPMLDWGILAAQLDLLALDLAEAQASASDAGVDASLQKLAGSVEFWQRVRAQPQDLFTVLFFRRVDRARLLDCQCMAGSGRARTNHSSRAAAGSRAQTGIRAGAVAARRGRSVPAFPQRHGGP